MKNEKNNETKSRKFGYFYVILLIFLTMYICIWFIIKNKVISILSNKSSQYDIEYDKLSVKLFPFSMESKISGLRFTILNKKVKFTISFDQLVARNLLFSKNITLSINKINYIREGYDGSIELIDDNMRFTIGKNNTLRNINLEAKEINILEKDIKDNNIVETIIGGFLFKTINIDSKSYASVTLKVNMDSIISKKDDKQLESNFEFIFSNMHDIDSHGKVVSVETEIDNISYNDITNNFGFVVNGNYKISQEKGLGKIYLNGKIINYNSLISAINKSDGFFVVKKELVSSFVQALKLIPANEKDTIYDKNYTLSADMTSKKMTINNIDLNEFLQSFLFKNGNSK